MNSRRFASGAVLYEIPYFADERGALNVWEIARELPFGCQRIFYTYTVPEGSVRGEHAHKTCEQFLISLRGVLTAKVDDGCGHVDEILLDTPSKGLWLPHGCWGEQSGHSTDNILLVLASLPYDSADYIRSYDAFIAWKRAGKEREASA